MFETEIKKYYDAIAPSDGIRTATLEKISRLRMKRASYKLMLECFVSAAACFIFAVIINFTEISGATAAPDKLAGTVLSEPNGYLIAGILLAGLIAAFVIIYRKTVKKYTDKKNKDMNK